MIKKILGTLSSRGLVAVLSLVNAGIGARYLGAEDFGTIALLIVGVTIFLMVNNLVGGSAVVYYASRMSTRKIIAVSYLWTGITTLLFYALLEGLATISLTHGFSFELIPRELTHEFLILAVLNSLGSIHLNVLVGHENIKWFNIAGVVQQVALTTGLVIVFAGLKLASVQLYVYCLFAAYGLGLILGAASSLGYLNRDGDQNNDPVFKALIRFGAYNQLAAAFQMLNYRLVYFLLDAHTGRKALGQYALANQLSEGLWIFSKSISVVQLSRIANSRNDDYAVSLTRSLLKLTLLVTGIALGMVVLIPASWWVFFFGDDFSNIPYVIGWLSPGILALAGSMIFSPYFSGIGLIRYNTWSSAWGAGVVIVMGIALIPPLGYQGAAIAASGSYLVSFFYQLLKFKQLTDTPWKEFLPVKADLRTAANAIKRLFTKEQDI